MKSTTYYATVYQDCWSGKRVLQVSNSIDSLSCEALAEPGVRSAMFDTVPDMRNWGQELARRYSCQHLEINCSKGLGSYQWLKTKVN